MPTTNSIPFLVKKSFFSASLNWQQVTQILTKNCLRKLNHNQIFHLPVLFLHVRSIYSYSGYYSEEFIQRRWCRFNCNCSLTLFHGPDTVWFFVQASSHNQIETVRVCNQAAVLINQYKLSTFKHFVKCFPCVRYSIRV